MEKNVTSLLPVVVDMDGHVLHMMYAMCLVNRDAMFDRLKADTSKEQSLTINTYLRFLNEIKQYVPMTADDKSNATSVICSLM